MKLPKKNILSLSLAFLLVLCLFPAARPAAVYAEEVPPDSETASVLPEETPDYSERIVTVKKSKFVSDAFHGVDALYRPGKNDGGSATYSCAAYIKKYYKTVYGLSVNNLYSGRTPNVVGGADSFLTVTVPKPGDIAAAPNHWSIVKAVNSDHTVVVIEQNWKWQQGGKTVTKVNRIVKNDSVRFFRLASGQEKTEALETSPEPEAKGEFQDFVSARKTAPPEPAGNSNFRMELLQF